MSQSGAQAAAFFRDVAQANLVWWVRDDEGSPAPVTSSGQRAVPYWSTQARAQRAAAVWGAEFRVVSMPLDQWRIKELPGLDRDGFLVGINWTGPGLTGWDFTVDEVVNRLAHALEEANRGPGSTANSE